MSFACDQDCLISSSLSVVDQRYHQFRPPPMFPLVGAAVVRGTKKSFRINWRDFYRRGQSACSISCLDFFGQGSKWNTCDISRDGKSTLDSIVPVIGFARQPQPQNCCFMQGEYKYAKKKYQFNYLKRVPFLFHNYQVYLSLHCLWPNMKVCQLNKYHPKNARTSHCSLYQDVLRLKPMKKLRNLNFPVNWEEE